MVETGVHWKAVTKPKEIPHAVVMAIATLVTSRKLLTEKIRR